MDGNEKDVKEFLKLFNERVVEKYDLIANLILHDDHIAEVGAHVEWISACIDTIICESFTGVIMQEELSFAEKEAKLKIAERNIKETLEVKFRQSFKELWALQSKDKK
jgi:hypothetical protein